MTREEAIAELNVLHERLSNPKDCEDGCYSWEDGWYVEAIDMAIEALSADAVSRKGYEEVKEEYITTVGAILAVISAPSCLKEVNDLIEPLKVVRCKDCRHIGLFSCPLADNDFQKDEDFCSWGEKRKESEEKE